MSLSHDTRRALKHRLASLLFDPEAIRRLARDGGLPPERLAPGLAADALWDAVLDLLELQSLELRLDFLAELRTLAPVLTSERLLTQVEEEWRQERALPSAPPNGLHLEPETHSPRVSLRHKGLGHTGEPALPTLRLHFVPNPTVSAASWRIELWRDGLHLTTYPWEAPDPYARAYGERLFEALFPPDHRLSSTTPHRVELTTLADLWHTSPLPGIPFARLAFPSIGLPVTDCGWTVLEPSTTPFSACSSGRVLVIESSPEQAHGSWATTLRSALFTYVEHMDLQTLLQSDLEALPAHTTWVVAEAECDPSTRSRLQGLALQTEAPVVVWCVGTAPPREGLAQVMLNVESRSLRAPTDPSANSTWLQRFLVQLRREATKDVDRSFALACQGLSDAQRSGLRLRGAPAHLTLEAPDPRVALEEIFQWYLQLDRSHQEHRLLNLLDRQLLSSRCSILAVLVPGPRGSAPEAFTERSFRPLRELQVHTVHSEWHLQPNEQLKALWRCLGTAEEAAFIARLRSFASENETLVLKVLHSPVGLAPGAGRVHRTVQQLTYYLECLRRVAQRLEKEGAHLKMLVMIPVEHGAEQTLDDLSCQNLSLQGLRVEVLSTLSLAVPEPEIREWLLDYGALPDKAQDRDTLLAQLSRLSYEQLVLALQQYLPNLRR